MKSLTLQDNLSFSTQFAVASFLVGTVLFNAYMVIPCDEILVFGVLYVVFAAFFNGLIIINLFHQLIIIPNQKMDILIKILIMLSNIPISVMYYYMVWNVYKS